MDNPNSLSTRRRSTPDHHKHNGGSAPLKTHALDYDTNLSGGEHSSGPLPDISAAIIGGDTPKQIDAVTPLQRPTLRVQGNEIILEEGLRNHHGSANLANIHDFNKISERETSGSLQLQQQPSGDIRFPSRATINTGTPHVNSMSRHAADTPDGLIRSPSGGIGSQRVRVDSVSSRGTDNLPPRLVKQPSTLTLENVQLVNKMGQSLGRVEHNERMWNWVHDSGPPYEASPSIAVGLSKASSGKASSHKPLNGIKRFLCLGCVS